VVKGKKPFAIKDVICDDGNFSCKTSASAGGRLHLLDLSYVANGEAEGDLNRTIKILTDLAEKPEISIPVVVTFAK
jgi:hypothetical protein